MDKEIENFVRYIKQNVSKEELKQEFRSYDGDFLFSFQYMSENFNPFSLLESNDISSDVQPFYNVVKKLIEKYSVKKWQFRLHAYNQIPTIQIATQAQFDGFLMIVPDVDDNIQIIDHEMNSCGYKRVKTETRDIANNPWICVTYNPVKKYSCDEWIRSGIRTLYHITPVENIESVKNLGIVPYNVNSLYQGEERSFFFKDSWREQDSLVMMQAIMINKRKYGFSGIAAVFKIDVDLISEDIHFYLDPNAECCVFTNDVITPSCIIFKESCKFDFINNKLISKSVV